MSTGRPAKPLEAINALKGCKHLNPDQKQISTIFRIGTLSLRARLAAWAGPLQERDQKAAKGVPLSQSAPATTHCRMRDPKASRSR